MSYWGHVGVGGGSYGEDSDVWWGTSAQHASIQDIRSGQRREGGSWGGGGERTWLPCGPTLFSADTRIEVHRMPLDP